MSNQPPNPNPPSPPSTSEAIGALETYEEDCAFAKAFLWNNQQPGAQAALRVINLQRRMIEADALERSNLTAELHEAHRTNTEINRKWAADRAALAALTEEDPLDDDPA